MEGVNWWTAVREWFRRVVRRRNGRSAAHDWFDELFSYAEMDEEPPVSERPALTPAVVEELSRQLNAFTPWNVRVEVESRRQGTAVRCGSRIGFDGEASGLGGGATDAPPLHYLLNVLHGVQSFMVNRTNRAWPRRERLMKEELPADAFLRALPFPDGAIEDGEAYLWYGERDAPALEFEPIALR